jgi:hypothetical protein
MRAAAARALVQAQLIGVAPGDPPPPLTAPRVLYIVSAGSVEVARLAGTASVQTLHWAMQRSAPLVGTVYSQLRLAVGRYGAAIASGSSRPGSPGRRSKNKQPHT